MATRSRVRSLPQFLDVLPCRAVALLLFVGVTLADLVTGYELNFFLFYLAPIMLVAWYRKKRMVVVLSLLSSTFWILADVYVWHASASSAHLFWNGSMRLFAFLLVGLLMDATRGLLQKEEAANAQLNQMLQEVRQLKGLLPICASCKKIRDDQGYWEEIDAYISTHTDATFSHGICPKCAARLYPDLVSGGDDPEDGGGGVSSG